MSDKKVNRTLGFINIIMAIILCSLFSLPDWFIIVPAYLNVFLVLLFVFNVVIGTINIEASDDE